MADEFNSKRSSYWAWPGPANAYIAAIIAVVAYLLTLHFGKSQFAMAVFVAVVLCYCLIDTAIRRRHLNQWTSAMAWSLRIFGAIIGYWLFIAAHPTTARIVAVVVYAVAYIACEWAVWRRVREYHRNLTESTLNP